MDHERLGAGLGIAASAAVLVLVAAPYALLDPGSVGVYYAVGTGGPPLVALFALLAIIVLAAGRRRRSDPALAAGVALALGGFMALLAWSWALAVTPSLLGGFPTAASFSHHRWLLAAAALLVPAGAGWFARAVL